MSPQPRAADIFPGWRILIARDWVATAVLPSYVFEVARHEKNDAGQYWHRVYFNGRFECPHFELDANAIERANHLLGGWLLRKLIGPVKIIARLERPRQAGGLMGVD